MIRFLFRPMETTIGRFLIFVFCAGGAALLFASSISSSAEASMSVNLRFADGSTSKSINTPDLNTDIPIQIWITIDGASGVNGTGDQFGLQFAAYSLLSARSGGGVNGALLSPQLTAPFNASGSLVGDIADLNSDGINDLGSLLPYGTAPTSPFAPTPVGRPRASSAVYDTSVLGQTQNVFMSGPNVVGVEFLVETVNFHVGSITPGTATQFSAAIPSWILDDSPSGANWWQNSTGSPTNGINDGTYLAGTSVTFAAVADPEWGAFTSGAWSTGSNWTTTVPNAVNAVATFGTLPSGPATVTVDSPKTVGSMTFHNANGYTLSGSSLITLDSTSGSVPVSATLGDHSIGAPMMLADNTAFAITVGSVLLNGAIDNSTGKAITKTGAGTLTIGGSQTHGVGAQLNVNGGVVNLDSNGGPNLSVAATIMGSSVIVNSTQHLASLSATSGALVTLTAPPAAYTTPGYTPGTTHVTTDSLAIDFAGGATVDLGNGAMIVNYSGPSPLASITAMAANASNLANFSSWDLPGLTSSVAAADYFSTGSLGVGVVDNNDLLNITLGYAYDGITGAQFNATATGEAVSADSILVKLTYYGDSDLNGATDITDYFLFLAGLTDPTNNPANWMNGDYDYSGTVDITDYFYFLAGLSATNTYGDVLSGGGGPMAVPEPSSILLLVLGGLAIVWTARRGATGRR